MTVITNAIDIAYQLAEFPKCRVIVPGGILQRNSLSLVGDQAASTLRDFYCDKCYLGADGIDIERGLLTSNIEEAHLMRINIRNAKKVIALIDSSKFQTKGIMTVASLQEVDMIITDGGLPDDKLKQLKALNIDELVGAWDSYLQLLKQKSVWLFFFGIFAYVGTEQGIANWISEFLRTYHDLSPESEGANTVSWFWGMLTLGCLLGLLLLKLLDSKIVLRIFTSTAILVLVFTLFGNATLALFGFPALGFCLSVMWSVIFSLALNSIANFHGSFSGILCTGIAGGAIVSLIIGQLKDLIGLQFGMLILFISLGYILSISFWAKPLIKNVTLKSKS